MVTGTRWSEQDDERLRRLYEAWAGDVIPVESIANALKRSAGAVRYRAHKLGLTEPSRPRAGRGRSAAVVVPRTCAQCGQPFTPRRASDEQKTCSRSCAARHRSAGRPRFHGRARVGRREDLGDIFFRSSWEANYARYLNHLLDVGKIVSWEYEPQQFWFPVKRGNKGYLPDFRVWITPDQYEWHEVKGYMDDASRIKLRRFALHFPEEHERFKLIDKPVYQALKALYSDGLEGWE